MARAALHRAAEAITASRIIPGTPGEASHLDGFVDDLKYVAARPTHFELAQDIQASTEGLLDFLLDDDYLVSDKSCIVSSSSVPAVRAAINAAYGRGAKLQHKTSSEDLGVDISSSRRRRVPKARARKKKAEVRNTRVIKLKVKRARRKLFSIAIVASQGYHVRAQGMPPTVIHRLRSQLAKHLGAKAGWCSHTIIAIEAGYSDPEVRFKLDAVKQHFETWTTMPELRGGIEKAWAKKEAWLGVTPANQRWYYIQRPLCVMQAVVRAEGWHTPKPNKWRDHEDTRWFFPDAYDESPAFFHWWAKRVRQNQWGRAAQHWHTTGSEQGACVQVVKQHIARLRRQDKCREAQLALCIACGSMWTGARVKAAGLSQDDKCQLCGAVDDDFHQAWGGCPVIEAAALPEVVRTKHWERRASEQAERYPCLWLRGLLPEELMPPIPPPHAESLIRSNGIFEGMDITAPGAFCSDGTIFCIDESGGEFTKDPLLRRCGAGAAAMPKTAESAGDPLHCASSGALRPHCLETTSLLPELACTSCFCSSSSRMGSLTSVLIASSWSMASLGKNAPGVREAETATFGGLQVKPSNSEVAGLWSTRSRLTALKQISSVGMSRTRSTSLETTTSTGWPLLRPNCTAFRSRSRRGSVSFEAGSSWCSSA